MAISHEPDEGKKKRLYQVGGVLLSVMDEHSCCSQTPSLSPQGIQQYINRAQVLAKQQVFDERSKDALIRAAGGAAALEKDIQRGQGQRGSGTALSLLSFGESLLNTLPPHPLSLPLQTSATCRVQCRGSYAGQQGLPSPPDGLPGCRLVFASAGQFSQTWTPPLNKAIVHDEQENYPAALKAYADAMDPLFAVLGCKHGQVSFHPPLEPTCGRGLTPSPSSCQIPAPMIKRLSAMLDIFMARAEDVRSYVQANKKEAAAAAAAAAGDADAGSGGASAGDTDSSYYRMCVIS